MKKDTRVTAIVLETGERLEFQTMTEASRTLNIPYVRIFEAALSGHRYKGFRFERKIWS